MDLKPFSLVFGVFLLLAVTGTSSQDTQPTHVDDTKIVGGLQASPYQFPYQVSLKYSSTSDHFCGGTLITDRHVLTAAQCIKSKTKTLGPQDFFIHSGFDYLPAGGNRSYVSEINVHSGFDVDTLVDDIAIIKLMSSLKISPSVKTIALRTTTSPTDTNCTVSGWGTTDYNSNAITEILRYVNVSIYDYDTCRGVYNNAVKDKMICAGFASGGKDACKGDSGGPLVCGNSVAGIVSFGKGCGAPYYPGVYTEVYKYNKWIKDEINASVPTSALSLCLLVIANFAYFLLH